MSRGNTWSGIVIMVWMMFLCVLFPGGGSAWAAAVPDTGQTQCYGESGAITPCPQAGEAFYGQDALYRINEQSYTKLGVNDVTLPATATFATGWVATRDNVTGLVWAIKSDDGGLHDKDNTYTWCNASQAANVTIPGVCGNGTDTKAFLQAVNTAKYAGHADWRLPTPQELQSLVHYGKYSPAIDSVFFANIQTALYWTSAPVASGGGGVWGVDFLDGYVYAEAAENEFSVMCVRGGSDSAFSGPWVAAGNGTVKDGANGLTWQQEDGQPKDWQQALSYCENLSLAGEGDWRLPEIKELATLVDYEKGNSTSRITFSSAVASFKYWSSTPDVHSMGLAWYVDFSQGGVASTAFFPLQVRCVRGGVATSSVTTTVGGAAITTSTTIKPTTTVTTKPPVTTTVGGAATTTSTTIKSTTTVTTKPPVTTTVGGAATTTSTTIKSTTTVTTKPPVTTTVSGAATTTSTTILPTPPTPPAPTQQEFALAVGSGWSLLSSPIGFQAATVFGASSKVTSVWKWAKGSWAVYLPGETTPGAYAKGKGFTVLSSIDPGEGFWVNSGSLLNVVIPGTPVYGKFSFTGGWNLVGLKSDQAMSVADLAAGQGITSLWAWQGGKWAVFLPGEKDGGKSYALAKGFGLLSSVKPGEGVWVNKP
ncbi:MAG: DUF1566 domain-containing protein [Proteobacteria bacterium]|nr:DUF1566 domain-containing protein [Pseudomonadota bacterium]